MHVRRQAADHVADAGQRRRPRRAPRASAAAPPPSRPVDQPPPFLQRRQRRRPQPGIGRPPARSATPRPSEIKVACLGSISRAAGLQRASVPSERDRRDDQGRQEQPVAEPRGRGPPLLAAWSSPARRGPAAPKPASATRPAPAAPLPKSPSRSPARKLTRHQPPEGGIAEPLADWSRSSALSTAKAANISAGEDVERSRA